MKRIIIIAAMALMSVSAFAQKFAYVDFNELVMLMPEMDEARATIEENTKTNEEILMTMYEEYQTKMQQYEQKVSTWTQSVREIKEKEIMDIQSRLEQTQQTLQQEIQQLQQQLQHLVHDLVDALVGAVDLVDHHDDPVTQLQCTGQNEAGLGHGALGCVHQKDYAVDHLQNTLDLAAEVCVSGGVYDVDLHTVVLHRGIFCEDRDAAFLLDGTRVHNTLHHGLIFMVRTALLQHTVHQGSLTVVNVGDDRYVCLLYTSPSPRDRSVSRMPSSA